MIRVLRQSGSPVLEGALKPGVAAYVDADWLEGEEGAAVPAITVDEAGAFHFDRHSWEPPTGLDADSAALLAFSSMAHEAIGALGPQDRGSTAVTGRGIAAAEVRRLLGAACGGEEIEQPRAIVDTTGDPEVIAGCTQRLADGGALVLAGAPGGRSFDLNLYPDVHVRGLQIVGVGQPLSSSPSAEHAGGAPNPAESLQAVSFGEPLPSAVWYRVQG